MTIATRRFCRSSNAPIHSFDTDSTVERIIRDPLTVLLGGSKLSIEPELVATDPYNRVGRRARKSER